LGGPQTRPPGDGAGPQQPASTFVVCFLVLLFFLDDPIRIRLSDTQAIYLADYVFRVAILLIIVTNETVRGIVRRDLRADGGPGPFLLTVGVTTGASVFVFDIIGVAIYPLTEWSTLAKWANISDVRHYWFDATIGIAMVAVTEEVVWRSLAWETLRRRFAGTAWPAVLSSVGFGLSHWAHGVDSIVLATLTGFLLWWTYRRTGGLIAPILAHYLIDVFLFYVGFTAMPYPSG